MNKILVFTTNWLGDALFLSPLLAGLKQNFAQAYLAVLSVPRVKEIFQNNPNVDEVIIYDEKGKHRSLIARLEIIAKLRRKKFDTAFIIKPSLTRTLILKFSKINKIIGFTSSKSGWLLTLQIPKSDNRLHKIDYFLNMLEYLELKINQRRYEFFPSPEDKNYVKELFLKKKIKQDLPIIVINPGANWLPKRWPADDFAELIKRIKQKFQLNIIITGAKKDRELSRRIIEQLSGEGVFDFTGFTSLGQLGALMQKADVVISADSGPMHIAAAVGKRVTALFGPTSAQITGPYPLKEHIIIQSDVGCRIPCYDSACKDYRCMKAITVEEVLGKVTQLLKG
ncbi:MAG: lipopolysaccharide heptosyltransferase II [Candidatus Omnitrophota bacterium]|jgi:lipopolysaccharide heptosyltransferase II